MADLAQATTALANPWGMAIGGGLGLLQAFTQSNREDDMIRIREKEVDQALNQNLANREALMQQSPEANRLAKANALQRGKATAVGQVANIAGGNIANSGLGGNVNSGAIAAAKAAPVAAAGAQYDNALANTYTKQAQEQAQLNQQLQQNTMQRGQLAEMTAYLDRLKNSRNNWLGMLGSGISMGGNIYDSLYRNQYAQLPAKKGA